MNSLFVQKLPEPISYYSIIPQFRTTQIIIKLTTKNLSRGNQSSFIIQGNEINRPKRSATLVESIYHNLKIYTQKYEGNDYISHCRIATSTMK